MTTKFSWQAGSLTAICALASMMPAFAQVPTAPDTELFNPRSADTSDGLPDQQIVAPWAPNAIIPPNTERNFKKFILPPPPSNRSDQTRLELEELNRLAATRTNPRVIRTISRWNFDPPASPYNDYFDYLVQKFRYSPPLAARCSAMLNQGIYAGLMAAWNNKYTYLRPRPDQVTGYAFKASPRASDTGVAPLQTPAHPAYPSGHSTSAGVFMAVGPACFPNEPVEGFVALGRESSLARRQGGVHYYSDSVAGEALGYAVGSEIVRNHATDGSPLGGNTAPDVYSIVNGVPRTTIQPARVTVTVGPQLAANSGGGQRIILVPISPFGAPPAVGRPAERIIIPSATTTFLTRPSTPKTSSIEFKDPNPTPNVRGTFNINAPLAPSISQ